ncbi:YciI family protein [Actinoplanes sp. NPDC023714]|uniref:YciI family protein n=1 Tax=Actinoplanes sp. NPDC023714 TaxID=3154322 RepID=UPI0033DE7A7D
MKFLISLHINPAVLESLTEEEQAAIGAGHQALLAETKESGELLSTMALTDPSQAAVVSVSDGRTVATDGPFAEAKEFLGGFYLFDVESRERAIELAARIPDAAIDGLGVEVRQVMFADGPLTGPLEA